VIGSPIRHSLSPVLHNAAFRSLGLDWVYLAFEVSPGDAGRALAGANALGIDGLSVTMPHKAAVAAAVDRLSPVAEALGAVNTVLRVSGRDGFVLSGENTDGAGFLDALRLDEGFDPAGQRCLVFGAGGAARAVVLALAQAGAAGVTVVNRTSERAVRAAALAGPAGRVGSAQDAAECALVVNATPVGMHDAASDNPSTLVDLSDIGPGQLVVDLVYHPAVTPLVEQARARGAAAVGGLGMLVHQAGHAFRLWTAEDPPLAAMSAAAMSALLPTDAA
jgi:shikimate dehydrogenase